MQREKSRTRNGFTLVELLVTISIIGFLASMFVLAYRGAQQEAFDLKTRSTIQKISDVLNARMEEYASYPITARVISPVALANQPIPSTAVAMVPGTASYFEPPAKLITRAKLLALRDMIRMEMPDHPDDLKWTRSWVLASGAANGDSHLNAVPRPIVTGLTFGATPIVIQNRASSRSMLLAKRLSVNSNGTDLPIENWEVTNANAELLYLVIQDSSLNGTSAIELFQKSEVRDTDGDGLNEFVDAYGNPIGWVRWPAGFGAIARYHPDLLDPTLLLPGRKSPIDSESLDRLGADPGLTSFANVAYKPGPGLFPLVVSPGPDNLFGIRLQVGAQVSTVWGRPSFSTADALWQGGQQNYDYMEGSFVFTDPWWPRNDNSLRMGATVNTRESGDNITNYDGNGASL